MAVYNVTITNDNQTSGVGPVRIVADTPQKAIEKVAKNEGMTVAQFIAAGLTVHMVEAAE